VPVCLMCFLALTTAESYVVGWLWPEESHRRLRGADVFLNFTAVINTPSGWIWTYSPLGCWEGWRTVHWVHVFRTWLQDV